MVAKPPPEFLYDKRVAERLIRKGWLTKQQWEQHVASLPDRSDNARWIPIPGALAREGSEDAPADPAGPFEA